MTFVYGDDWPPNQRFNVGDKVIQKPYDHIVGVVANVDEAGIIVLWGGKTTHDKIPWSAVEDDNIVKKEEEAARVYDSLGTFLGYLSDSDTNRDGEEIVEYQTTSGHREWVMAKLVSIIG